MQTDEMITPYSQEAALIDYLPNIQEGKILCTSSGRAQFAVAAAGRSNTEVVCHFIDAYRAELARAEISAPIPNLRIVCSADFPAETVDVVALSTSATGEAELTRDFMQQGFQRLRIGGQMVVSSNNSKDSWVYEQMKHLFPKVNRQEYEKAVIYSGIKTEEIKKIKNFTSEFAFRDQGRLIKAFSRPGVFSHRHLDVGARKLMDAMEIKDGFKVLDIGCGWGAVGLAAALRAQNVQVECIDSNTRAIECTEKSRDLNSVKNITTKLTATGEHDGSGLYDVVLANPPYYSNFRIAELFAVTGEKALKSGGQILFVTKSPQWYGNNLSRWFKEIKIQEAKEYFIVSGYKE